MELSDLSYPTLIYEDNPVELAKSDFYIVTVPTPIASLYRPNLGVLYSASEIVGSVLKRGDIVVYEFTVYPGAVEGDCVPSVKRSSSLGCGRDFGVGYSPERINPGDKEHRFETISKVIAGQDDRTLQIVGDVYSSVVKAGIYCAPSIKATEAAKVIENAQRDLNIGFMNELSAIFERLGIDTGDVLAAAATKWNFSKFQPGLVSGHCVGGDPYYLLTYKGKAGATVDIIEELRSFDLGMQVHDPVADSREEVKRTYGIELTAMERLRPADAVILAVAHESYVRVGWPLITRLLKGGSGVVLDAKFRLERHQRPRGVDLWCLWPGRAGAD